jgi:hypothetical protein
MSRTGPVPPGSVPVSDTRTGSSREYDGSPTNAGTEPFSNRLSRPWPGVRHPHEEVTGP